MEKDISTNGSANQKKPASLMVDRRIHHIEQKKALLRREVSSRMIGTVRRRAAKKAIRRMDRSQLNAMAKAGWGVYPGDPDLHKDPISTQVEVDGDALPPLQQVRSELRGGINGVLLDKEGKARLISSDILLKVEEWNTPEQTDVYNRNMDALGWE